MTIDQQKPMAKEEVEVYEMTSAGFLPAPSCTSPAGSPVWDIDGIARFFDMGRSEFLELIRDRGPVYAESRSIPSTWPMLVEGS
jgi:hypothetical protein